MAKTMTKQEITGDSLELVAKDLQYIIDNANLADKAITDMAKSMKDVKMPNLNTKELKDTEKLLAEVNKMFEDKIIIDKEAIKIQQEVAKLEGLRDKNERANARERDRIAKQEQANANRRLKQEKDNQSAFRQTQLRANELYNQLRDLAIVGDTNTKTYRNLKREYDNLDKSLKTVDASFGKNFRNVGNYTNAVNGLKSGLAQLGLAFSGFALARNAFNTMAEFDEKVADVIKTTGLGKEAVIDMSIELGKMDTRSSVTALQELASAGGRLGLQTKKDIVDFARSADMAFVALGDDLGGSAEEIATQLGKISSTFGDEQKFGIGEAITRTGSSLNELSAKSKASAGAILDFTNRMAGVASVSGIAQTDIQALGALFDSTGQSIEVASTTLNVLLPKLATDYEKFAKVAGMTANEFKALVGNNPIEALKQVAIGAQSSEKGLNGLVKTLESFGVESSRGAAIVGTLANNTKELTRLQDLSNKAFSENVSLQDEFNTKNETMSAGVEKLRKEWDLWVIELMNSTGATSNITYALNLIAKNLPTIISLLGKLIAAFVTWRTVMFSMKLAQQIKDIGGLSGAFSALTGNIKGATTESANFGKALKGVGWTVAIGLAVEMGMALYDIFSGAKQARYAIQDLNDSMSVASSRASQRVGDIKKAMEDERSLLANNTKLSKAELEKQLKDIDDSYKSRLELAIKYAEEQLKLVESSRSDPKRVIFESDASYNKRAEDRQNARVEGANEYLRLLKLELTQLNRNAAEQVINDRLSANSSEQKAKEIQDYTKSVRDLRNELNSPMDKEVVALGYAFDDALEKLDKDGKNYAKYVTELEDKLLRDVTAIRKKYADEEKARQLQAELDRREHLIKMQELSIEITEAQLDSSDRRENLDQLKEYYSDREKAFEKYGNDREKLEIELDRLDSRLQVDQLNRTIETTKKRIENIKTVYAELLATDDELLSEEDARRKRALQTQLDEYELMVLESQNNISDIMRESQEKQAEQTKNFWKRTAETINNLIGAVQEKINQMYDRQINQENRLIDSSKRRIDYLTQAAAMGNQIATDSILAEEKKQEEALRRIEKIEQKKQRSQFITSTLALFNTKIANGDKNPVLSTIGESVVLNSFLRSLPSFKKGVEYFDTNGSNVDGQGGKLSILHNKERVMTADQNYKVGYNTPNNVVADVMYKYRIGALQPINQVSQQQFDFDSMLKPFTDEIRKGMADITTVNVDFIKVVGNMWELIERTKKGNSEVIGKKRFRA